MIFFFFEVMRFEFIPSIRLRVDRLINGHWHGVEFNFEVQSVRLGENVMFIENLMSF